MGKQRKKMGDVAMISHVSHDTKKSYPSAPKWGQNGNFLSLRVSAQFIEADPIIVGNQNEFCSARLALPTLIFAERIMPKPDQL